MTAPPPDLGDPTTPIDTRTNARLRCNRILLQLVPQWLRGVEATAYVGAEPRPIAARDDILLCSQLPLKGHGLTVTVVVVAASHTMDALLPPLLRRLPMPPCLYDWTGELVNQLAGKLQGELARIGLPVNLSLPKTVLGRKVLVDASDPNEPWHRFDVEGHPFRVRLVFSFDRHFRWTSDD